jgi:hypothetical protein
MTACVVDTSEFYFQQSKLGSDCSELWILHKSHSFTEHHLQYDGIGKETAPGAEPTFSSYLWITRRGGLVFGPTITAISHHDTSFVLLSSWAFPSNNPFWEAHHFTKDSHPRSATGAYYYTFLAVRWIDRKRGVCERVGVAHMMEPMWLRTDIARREQEVILV